MSFSDSFKKDLIKTNNENFNPLCIDLFNYQFNHCDIYNKYCISLDKTPENTYSIDEIPFLPIEFFKTHAIKSGKWNEEKVFKSSGTTNTGRSQHFIKDTNFYLETSKHIFEEKYGNISDFQIIAMLPSYLEQEDSSLIQMIDYFIEIAHPESGYFLEKKNNLEKTLSEPSNKKLLIGVSYALLDLSEKNKMNLRNTIIMETGGMKGRRKEITRDELHTKFKSAFEVSSIHSEYGMTELMSQAYGTNGLFEGPSWFKVLIRDINDPFSYLHDGRTGGINIIDFANVDSCSFIETKDLGRAYQNQFEILGRFDNSDIRGCNLMI